MLKNYLKTAIRSLLKNKGFSIINILGLGIGIASFILITLYVYHELSFDRFHSKGDRIFRVVENLRTENEMLLQSTSSPPMGPGMKEQFPEVESYVRFNPNGLLVRKGDKAIYEEECLQADSTIFDIFDFALVKGNAKTALTEPYTIVLTESTAKKYFGDDDPVGETLNMYDKEYKITGIVADVPDNSHFRFDILISFSTWSSENKGPEQDGWFWNGFHTYLLLRDKNDADKVRSKMKAFIDKNIGKGDSYYEDLPLQSLTSIYLETPRIWENGKRGSINNIYTLSIIAVFILVIACFNYINLATARASRRLKEVGLRKVLGAQRRSLIYQFMGESMIVSILATLLGFQLAFLALPSFNSLVESSLHFGMFPSPHYVTVGLAAIALTLGFLSGFYPAVVISGFQPLQIFRGSPRSIFGHNGLRKLLVSAQFAISITLVAGTLLVFNQLDLLKNRDLGFKKDGTLLIAYNANEIITKRLETVKEELNKVRGVASVTASASVPGEATNNLFASIEMKDGKISPTSINTNFVDHDFLTAYGIDIVAGRDFSKSLPADDTTAFILNETAVRNFGMTPQDVIGKKVSQYGRNGTVIGVAEDFHYRSLHHKIEPLMFVVADWAYSTLSLRVDSDDMRGKIDAVGAKWKELSNNLPYRYSLLDENYDKLYKADAQLGDVASVFSGLAIFVGCLGLLGLTSFSVERRVKEIGIRKVLGASVSNVILILSKEFVLLIVISFVVSVPLTYYLITRWLENFTEKINIGPASFLIAGFSVLAIALITMSYLSFRAAMSNPTQALRNE